MKKGSLIDLVGWAGLLAWLVISVYFAVRANGPMFQRAGTIGIAAGVAYYAMLKHAVPYPYGLLPRLTLSEKISDLHGAMIDKLCAQVGMTNASEKQTNPDALAAQRTVLLSQQVEAERQVNSSARISFVFQSIVVVLGTLQSGYGDILLKSACAGASKC